MTVELFGPARELAGEAVAYIAVDEPASFAAVIAALARAIPAFVGQVIDEDRRSLLAPNLMLLDGTRAAEDAMITSADRPCLLFLASGG